MSVFTLGTYVRRDHYNYYPSGNPFADFVPDLQSQTVQQDRTLTNAGVHPEISYAKGVHNLKAGVVYQHTFVNENDTLGIVDPTFLGSLVDTNNNPCVNASGVPIAPPCSTLLPFDLTRGGTLFGFRGHADVKETALYLQDTITKNSWSFNLGLRGDFYNGLTTHQEAKPRVRIAYSVKPSNTVLQVSYARVLETPFNENLVLSSVGCGNPY